MNTPAVTDHLGGTRELHEIEASFAQMASEQAKHGFGFMLVQHKRTGMLIGKCGLMRIDQEIAPAALQGQLSIGWTLREDYWHQGYAFEVASATLEFAFSRHNAAAVFATTADRNVPSWRLMEKLGMVRRRELDFDDPDYPPEDNPTIVFVKERPMP